MCRWRRKTFPITKEHNFNAEKKGKIQIRRWDCARSLPRFHPNSSEVQQDSHTSTRQSHYRQVRAPCYTDLPEVLRPKSANRNVLAHQPLSANTEEPGKSQLFFYQYRRLVQETFPAYPFQLELTLHALPRERGATPPFWTTDSPLTFHSERTAAPTGSKNNSKNKSQSKNESWQKSVSLLPRIWLNVCLKTGLWNFWI